MSKNARVNAIFIQAGVPLCNWGGPGVGKTQSIYAIGRALNANTEVLTLSSMDPTELCGVYCPPKERGKGIYREPPFWALECKEAWERAKQITIIFLDEANTAPPAVMAPGMKMMDEKMVGNLYLPGARFVAAINPPDIACGGQELPPPVANRMGHREWESDAKEWIHGMISGFNDPAIPILAQDWEALIRTNAALVASYIEKKRTSLYQIPKNEIQRGKAWPSPRTWTLSARVMAACESVGMPLDQQTECVECLVGTGEAMEFGNWRKEMDLPNPEDVLRECKKFKVTSKMRVDQVFAISAGVAAAFVQKKNGERWEQVWTVLGKVADAQHADVAGLAAQTVVQAVVGMPQAERRKEYPVNADLIGPFLPLIKQLNDDK